MPTGIGGEKLWLCPTLDDSANDLSGNSNNGTYNGGMGTITLSGSGGSKAYDFDGSNDYISLSQLIDSSYSALAFSAWVYVDLWGHNDVWIQQGSNPRAIRISTRGEGVIVDNFTVVMFGGGVNDIYSTATSVGSTGSWHHWLFQSASGGSGTLHVDGVLQSGNWTSGTLNVNGTTYIGASSSGEYADVKMDDIRVFDRLLSSSEITHLATSRGIEGSPYTYSGIGDEKLWLCPSLDDSADDISGNGNHGTYNGGMGTVADTSNGGTRAYSFDGVGDYIEGSSSGVVGLSAYSVALWYNTANNAVKVAFNAGDSGRRTCNIDSPKISGTFNIGHQTTTSNFFRATSSFATSSTWQHLVYTFDGSTFRIYIDGSLDATHTSITASNVTETKYRVGSYISG